MKVSLIGILVLVLAGIPAFGNGKGDSVPKDSFPKNNPEKGSGIIFFTTEDLEKIKDFYISEVGCELWLDQGTCLIFRYGNLLLGFCQGEKADIESTITFFYPKKEGVDRMYEKFKDRAQSPPQENPQYRIYHFYIEDPEGRSVEFQCFLHPLDWEF